MQVTTIRLQIQRLFRPSSWEFRAAVSYDGSTLGVLAFSVRMDLKTDIVERGATHPTTLLFVYY